MNLVLCGTLFQNTTASRPKLFPSTDMTKGVLLTGAVLGASAVSAGGVKLVPNVTFGSCIGVPQPRVRRRTNPSFRKARNQEPRLAERIRAPFWKWRAFYRFSG